MAIVVESSASATAAAATSLTINKPTGTASGDVLVAFIQTTRDSAIDTPASGWTAVEGAATYGWWHVFYLVAGGSEPASYQWQEPTSDWHGVMFRLSGVDNTTPLDAATVTGDDTAYNTSFTATGITTATDGAIVFASVWKSIRYITTGPGGGWTDGYLSAAAPALGVAYQIVATAGASGNAVFTASASERNVFATLAFRPAAAAGSAGGIMLMMDHFNGGVAL